MFLETKSPRNESSWEGKVQEMKAPRKEKSREQKFPGTKVLWERKVPGTNVSHRDYTFLGTKGTKGLGYEKSVIHNH